MKQHPDCVYPYTRGECPINAVCGCDTCGWNAKEAARRRELPLVRDKVTGLRHKVIRRGGDAGDADN